MDHREIEEMYLKTIFQLRETMELVRSKDIADQVGRTRATVSYIVKQLTAKEYIRVEPSGNISLTSAGEKRVRSIYESYDAIKAFFVELGADETLAAENACRMEHIASPELLAAIRSYMLRS